MEGFSAVPPRRLTPEELLQDAVWVRLLARALVADPHVAHDLEQEAWLVALRRPPLSGEGRLAWWKSVLHSRLVDRGRRVQRRERHESNSWTEERAEEGPLDTLLTLEANRRLLNALDALDDPYRSAIVARLLQGLTITDIAHAAQVGESTIRARIQKGLDRLRQELDERTPGGRAAWSALLTPLAGEIGPPGATTVGIGQGAWIAAASGLIAFVAGLAFLLGDAPDPGPSIAERSLDEAASQAPAFAAVEGGQRRAVDVPIDEVAPETAVAPAGRARIAVRLVDESKRPVVQAEVVCLDRVTPGAIHVDDAPRARPDSDGRVVLELAASDRSARRARSVGDPANTATHVLEIRGPGLRSQQLRARARLGAQTDLGEVLVLPGTRLTGRVLDDSGRPLASAGIHLLPPDVSLEERHAAKLGAFDRSARDGLASTDVQGEFELSGAPIGTWIVRASKAGHATAISAPFELVAGVPHELDALTCGPHPYVIAGLVALPAELPAHCVTVYWRTTAERAGGWVGESVDDQGRFTLNVDGPGPFVIAATTSGTPPGSARTGRVEGILAGARDVVLSLAHAPTIEVVAHDASGAPLAQFNLGVRLESGDGRIERTSTSVGVVPVPAIPFHVLVDAEWFAQRALGPYTLADAPARLEVDLERVPWVHGRVVHRGAPVRSVPVHVAQQLQWPSPGPDGFPVRLGRPLATDLTLAEGTFSLEHPGQGPFRVWTSSPKGRVASSSFHEFEGELVLDLANTGQVTGRVRLPQPAAQEDPETFVVRFADGSSAPDVVPLGADGSFDLGLLAVGTWTLVADLKRPGGIDLARAASYGDHPLARSVVVTEGASVHVELDLDPRAMRGVEGRLALAGAPRRTWFASLRHADEPESARRSVEIAPDGAFFVPSAAPGENVLVLRALDVDGRDTWIEARVELAHVPVAWRLEHTAGTLTVAGPAGAGRVLAIDLGAGRRFTTRFDLDATGRARLDGLPNGVARITDPGGRAGPLDVEVPALGTAHASLP